MSRFVKFRKWLFSPTLLLGLMLVVGNAYAWLEVASRIDVPQVEGILRPEIQEIKDHWTAQDAVGERFEVTVTNQSAAETVMWVIESRPRLQSIFSHPQIEWSPDGVTGRAVVRIGGLKLPVFASARVGLKNGKPDPQIYELGVAGASVPQWIMDSMMEQIDRVQAIYNEMDISVTLTELELREGEIFIRGVYR